MVVCRLPVETQEINEFSQIRREIFFLLRYFWAVFSEAYGESKEARLPPVLIHMVQRGPEAVFFVCLAFFGLRDGKKIELSPCTSYLTVLITSQFIL